ncbi:NACHT domain-containing protein [Streptomyces niveus]|uniref:NACHT domain-containing protein n=1 Tax=Streptomyces niveus TaxID=193462 RepID=UPI00344EBF3B
MELLQGERLSGGGGGIAGRVAARKALQNTPETYRADALEKVDTLTPATREKVANFITTGDFEQFTLQLAIAISAGKSKMLPKLHRSLRESLRIYRTVPDESLDAVTRALFDDIQNSVTLCLANFGADKKFSLVSAKISAAQAAASVKNLEILTRVNDLHAYDDFHKTLSRQVSLIDSKMRPPQIDAGRQVAIDKIYVPSSLKEEGEEEELTFSTPILLPKDIFDLYPRVTILGDPGGGKSTLATKLCVDLARGRNVGSSAKVPFKILVRDYGTHFQRSKMSIIEYIEKMCTSTYSVSPPQGCIEYLLLNSRAAVVFDGIDELTETALRQDMVNAVEAFSLIYPGVPILVTSRKVGYDLAPLDSDLFETLSLGRFSSDQRQSYVRNWFGSLRAGTRIEQERLASDFMGELTHADDLSSNPLMLGLMCALYRGAGFIPRNRPELYRRCSEFLFERWDSSRGITVEKPFERGIQYAMFALALNLMRNSDSSVGLTEKMLVRFTTEHLFERRYEDFDAAQDAARSFVEYCRGRAWVLTDVGTDASGNELYAFTHRTFLEYFAARQLVRECSDAETLSEVLHNKLRSQEWDVVAQLSIQTLDERLLDGSNKTMLALIAKARQEEDPAAQMALAGFCARSIEFMDLRPAVLREIIDFYVRCFSLGTSSRELHSLAASTTGILRVAEELRPLILDQVRKTVSDLEGDPSAIAFAITLGTQEISYRTHHRSHDFWANECIRTITEFWAEIEPLCITDPWFASRMYRYHKFSLAQVLSWHGTGVLFNVASPMGGREDNLFTGILYGNGFLDAPGIEHRRDRQILAAHLVQSTPPWARPLQLHHWVHDELDTCPDDGNELFLSVINMMLGGPRIMNTIFKDRKRWPHGSRGAVYRDVWQAREGNLSDSRLRARLTSLTDDQVDFISRWTTRKVDSLLIE